MNIKKPSKDQLWNEIVRQNPSFTTQGANLSPAGVYKFYCLVWEKAEAWGKQINPDIGEAKWFMKNIFGS